MWRRTLGLGAMLKSAELERTGRDSFQMPAPTVDCSLNGLQEKYETLL
jgi:hypothetical protein